MSHRDEQIYIDEVKGHRRRYNRVVQFTHSSTRASMVMLAGAIIAVVVASTSMASDFSHFWHTEISIGIGDAQWSMSLGHVINDLFMGLFFLLVGLEIKYEMTVGELTDIKQALLPIVAAVGGVVAPVSIYLALNASSPDTISGWGVPSATDIAFALGIMSLLGSRIPNGIKVFLSTLAVADDIIAIVIIAIFYGHSPSILWMIMSLIVLGVLVVLNRARIYAMAPYMIVGFVLWFCVYMSGIHATIAGVLLAFVIPSTTNVQLRRFLGWSGERINKAAAVYSPDQPVIAQREYLDTVQSLGKVSRQVVPPAVRIEHKIYPWVYFAILPVFALSNADVSVTGEAIARALENPALPGVFFGLLIGKPLGILVFSLIIVKLHIVNLPQHVNWAHMSGAAVLGGVGFTMAIFVANLAYTDVTTIAAAKVGILAGSLIAGAIGFLILRSQASKAEKQGINYVEDNSDGTANLTVPHQEEARINARRIAADEMRRDEPCEHQSASVGSDSTGESSAGAKDAPEHSSEG